MLLYMVLPYNLMWSKSLPSNHKPSLLSFIDLFFNFETHLHFYITYYMPDTALSA